MGQAVLCILMFCKTCPVACRAACTLADDNGRVRVSTAGVISAVRTRDTHVSVAEGRRSGGHKSQKLVSAMLLLEGRCAAQACCQLQPAFFATRILRRGSVRHTVGAPGWGLVSLGVMKGFRGLSSSSVLVCQLSFFYQALGTGFSHRRPCCSG